MYSDYEIMTTDDVERVDFILTKAFTNCPTMRWAIPPDTGERERWLRGYMHAEQMFARRLGGLALMDTDGTATWVLYGYQPDPLPEADLKVFYDEIAEAAGPAGERCVALLKHLQKNKPEGLPANCYTGYAGALPDGHHRGAIVGIVNWLRGYTASIGVELYGEAFSRHALQRWIRGGFVPASRPIKLPDGSHEVYPILTQWNSALPSRWRC